MDAGLLLFHVPMEIGTTRTLYLRQSTGIGKRPCKTSPVRITHLLEMGSHFLVLRACVFARHSQPPFRLCMADLRYSYFSFLEMVGGIGRLKHNLSF